VLECPEALEAVDVSRTKTNRTANKCEKELEKELENLFSLIVKNNMSELSARQQFEEELRSKVRHCVQKSFFAGMDYVGIATGVQPALQVQDVMIMEQVTEEILNDFFTKVSQREWKNVEFVSDNMLQNQINTIASSNMFRIINLATTSSMQALNAQGQVAQRDLVFTTEDDINVCPVCYPYHDRIYSFDDEFKPELPIHPHCRCRYLVADDQGNGIVG